MPNSETSRLDPEKIRKLAQLGLTKREICSIMECSIDRLNNFESVIEEGREHRNASVRRKQFEIAMAGNPTMLIWLGKQYLEQSDKAEVKNISDPLAELLSEFRSQYQAMPKTEAPDGDS
jgi:hypothetical protein